MPAGSAGMIYDEGDCNPLHRRIPGEVVSRRYTIPKRKPQEEEPEEVQVELRVAIALKPDARLKWLTRALKMVGERKCSSTDLFDIITSRKFVSGLAEKVVRKLHTAIQDGLNFFSDKQQRYLNSNECPITARLTFRNTGGADLDGFEGGVEEDEPEGEEKEKERRPEDEERKPPPPSKPARQPVQVEMAEGRRKPEAKEPREPKEERAPKVEVAERPQKEERAQKQEPKEEGGGSQWTSVTDEWSMRRAEKETKATKGMTGAEKRRKQDEDEEAHRREKESKEAAMRRKLEEEADNLFGLVADAPPPVLALSSRGRSHSRSRSISSRTARRLAKENNKKKDARPQWTRSAAPDALTGSRALLLNRNYQEDLPHMARPGAGGGGGSERERPASFGGGRSRSRSRRRRR